MKPLILASGSPRRAKILRDLGVEFEVVKTEAPEVSIPNDPVRTVTENACAKLRAAAVAISCDPPEVVGRAILAADTIVWFDNRIYGKPRDLEEAKEFLRELSGQTHVVFTGVAFRAEDGTERTVCVESHVTFRALSEEMIEVYVARVHPTDRAGAYDIDESGDLIVASYTGSYENIMGLPVEPLRGFGILESAPSTTH
ncbi:MAG: septum formation protein Maf [Kiritimatiellae bacterium]|nr:septum formation protein Maf [Kiritimatiellia bacterium]